ncbi:unnamed protein product [Rotaria magnacalcarata]|uniref:G domain-containing protein n=1 Tax=Rotaria magnacalcarata TaxID=392030 RepID=A0A814JAN1_9BILA|nr:unnamed protein product [Rotaria magnacalcarata]
MMLRTIPLDFLLSTSNSNESNFDRLPNILLIGETGAGKSTFINYLYNYFNKGELNNLKNVIPCKYHPITTEEFSHHELNINDNTQSKTNGCTRYIFTDRTINKQYLFIDTPGLSDTRSVAQNEINMNKIIETVTQLDNLTAIILIVNGSMSRLTMNFRYAINCLNSNIPDIVLENVIVILTNVKKHESPFDIRVLNLHGNIYPFYMQNGAFVSDPRTWSKSIHDELQYEWNHSMNQMKSILQTIDSFQQTSIDSFVKMKEIRNELKSIIHQVRLEMIQIQKIQDEIIQLDLGFQKADRDMLAYRDHTQSRTIEKIEQIDAPYHSTLCANCNQVCHNNCRLNETIIVGAQIFMQCLSMKDGKCQKCDKQCSYMYHYHAKKTIQRTHETVHNILADLKSKYDQANQNHHSYAERMITISETKELLEHALEEKIKEIKKKSVELNEICSSFNLAQEFNESIKQLKIESDLLRNLETKSKADKFIKKLAKIANLIGEKQDQYKRRQSYMQIIDRDVPIETKSTANINILTTSDLINLCNTTTDRDLVKSISNELHQRAIGNSTGPLSTQQEIIIIQKCLEKYNHKSIHELSYSYHRLQKQIEDILKGNILNLRDVNSELFIENLIVQTLLKQKDEKQGLHHDSVFQTMPSMISSFPQPVSSTSTTMKRSNSQSYSIGLSHLTAAPYPIFNNQSSMPALPSDYSPTIEHNKAQSKPFYPPETNEYDPPSINNQQRLTNFRDSNVNFQLNKVIENPSISSSTQHSSMPDVVPITNDTFDLSKLLLDYSTNESTTNSDNVDLCALTNAHLLSTYNDTNVNESKKRIILQELERRCYGEYPILIIEKRDLLHEKMKLHQMKTIGELKKAQAANKQKIRIYLKNDDFTLINEIPIELIIEASALTQLILSK